MARLYQASCWDKSSVTAKNAILVVKIKVVEVRARQLAENTISLAEKRGCRGKSSVTCSKCPYFGPIQLTISWLSSDRLTEFQNTTRRHPNEIK